MRIPFDEISKVVIDAGVLEGNEIISFRAFKTGCSWDFRLSNTLDYLPDVALEVEFDLLRRLFDLLDKECFMDVKCEPAVGGMLDGSVYSICLGLGSGEFARSYNNGEESADPRVRRICSSLNEFVLSFYPESWKEIESEQMRIASVERARFLALRKMEESYRMKMAKSLKRLLKEHGLRCPNCGVVVYEMRLLKSNYLVCLECGSSSEPSAILGANKSE